MKTIGIVEVAVLTVRAAAPPAGEPGREGVHAGPALRPRSDDVTVSGGPYPRRAQHRSRDRGDDRRSRRPRWRAQCRLLKIADEHVRPAEGAEERKGIHDPKLIIVNM